jgi:hypothetical protein
MRLDIRVCVVGKDRASGNEIKKKGLVFLIVVPFSGFVSTKIRNKNFRLLLDLYQVGLFI